MTLPANERKMQEQARIIYLSSPTITVEELAKTTGIPEDTLSALIYGEDENDPSKGCWHSLKKNMTDSAIIAVMANQRGVVEHTGKLALNIIQNTLSRLNEAVASGAKELEIDDLIKITTVFEKMDKIVRLDDGLPTETTRSLKLSYEQQKKIAAVMNDPFAKEEIVDVEIDTSSVVEVEDDD